MEGRSGKGLPILTLTVIIKLPLIIAGSSLILPIIVRYVCFEVYTILCQSSIVSEWIDIQVWSYLVTYSLGQYSNGLITLQLMYDE